MAKKLARLWVCVYKNRRAAKKRKIQANLLNKTKHGLMSYDQNDDGYYDVAAVGPLKRVLAYVKKHGLQGFVIDVEDKKSAKRVEAAGCEACLENHGLAKLHHSLVVEAAATAMHS